MKLITYKMLGFLTLGMFMTLCGTSTDLSRASLLLIKGVDAGDVAQVRAAIADGADVNVYKQNFTVLMWAIMLGHADIADQLINAKADVNALSIAHEEVVDILNMISKTLQDSESTKKISERIPGANEALEVFKAVFFDPAFKGKTPAVTALTLAAFMGNKKMIDKLLNAHAHIHLGYPVDALSATIMGDIFRRRITIIRDDIAGKDIPYNEIPDLSKIPMDLAIINTLLKHGADVNHKNQCNLTPLAFAVARSDVQLVNTLLKHGADANVKLLGFVPLIFGAVAIDSKKSIIDALIKHGANINAQCPDHGTPLFLAAYTGKTELVKTLVGFGADLNVKNVDGKTPLDVAKMKQQHAVVKLLMKAGAQGTENEEAVSNAKEDTYGFYEILGSADNTAANFREGKSFALFITQLITVIPYSLFGLPIDKNGKVEIKLDEELISAIYNRNTKKAAELISVGANVNARREDGRSYPYTALMVAAQLELTDIAKLLIEGGADVNAELGSGAGRITALIEATNNKTTDIVKLLLDNGADANIYQNSTPLVNAMYWNRPDTVKLLIEKGANIKANKDGEGDKTITWAARNGHIEIVKLLLEKGVEVNITNNDGKTALMEAAANGHIEIVKLLLDKGADVTIADNKEKTALDVAANDEIKTLLHKAYEEHKNDLTDKKEIAGNAQKNIFISDQKFIYAIEAGNIKKVKEFLSLGANVNAKGDTQSTFGRRALVLAAEHGHTDIVKLLFNAGADVNAKDKFDRTALMMAAANGDTDSVKLLLNAGADVNAKDNNRMTALIWAAENGQTEVVKLLLEKDVVLNQQDTVNRTALLWAAEKGYTAVVRLLLEKGADVNAKTIGGFTITALKEAAREGHTDVVKLLLEKRADSNDVKEALDVAANDEIKTMLKKALEIK